ncbi:hypothetical protein T492DRAFT_1073175 [Pavlovales sp. CCMP2436]|nr:hypothetical protein T492DRAFT_1073175 [Pavlovales sp. CCMP2436]
MRDPGSEAAAMLAMTAATMMAAAGSRRRVSEAGPSSTQPLYRPIVQAPRIPRFILAADLDQAPAPLAGWVLSPICLLPAHRCPPPTHGRYHPPTGRDARPRAHIDIPRALWETLISLSAGGTGGRKLALNDKSEQEAFWCRLKDGKTHDAVLVDKLVTAAAAMRAKPAREFVIVRAREPTVTNVWKS